MTITKSPMVTTSTVSSKNKSIGTTTPEINVTTARSSQNTTPKPQAKVEITTKAEDITNEVQVTTPKIDTAKMATTLTSKMSTKPDSLVTPMPERIYKTNVSTPTPTPKTLADTPINQLQKSNVNLTQSEKTLTKLHEIEVTDDDYDDYQDEFDNVGNNPVEHRVKAKPRHRSVKTYVDELWDMAS